MSLGRTGEKRVTNRMNESLFMNPRIFTCWFVALFIAASTPGSEQPATEWGAVSNEVQMAISLKGDARAIETNEAFQLRVRVKNMGGTNVWSTLGVAPVNKRSLGIECEIISPSGRDVSPVPPKENYILPHFVGLNVPPGKVEEFEFKLSDICKLDEVGTYKITAKKWIGRDKNQGWVVTSNPLFISVVATNSITTNDVPVSKPN